MHFPARAGGRAFTLDGCETLDDVARLRRVPAAAWRALSPLERTVVSALTTLNGSRGRAFAEVVARRLSYVTSTARSSPRPR